jgi:hypothetical protein
MSASAAHKTALKQRLSMAFSKKRTTLSLLAFPPQERAKSEGSITAGLAEPNVDSAASDTTASKPFRMIK